MTSHTLLGGVFQSLQEIGAFQFVLFPLLTFAIVYGVLQKVGIFEDDNQIDAVIAIVIAAFAAIYVPVGGSMVVFLSNMFGAWAVVLVVIVLAMTGAGLVGWKPSDPGERGKMEKGIMAVAVLALVFIFLSWGGVSIISPSQLGRLDIFLSTQDFLALLVVALGVFAVYYVGFGGNGENGGGDTEPDEEQD